MSKKMIEDNKTYREKIEETKAYRERKSKERQEFAERLKSVKENEITELIEHLNHKANRKYKTSISSNRGIAKRALADYQLEGLKLMVDDKCAQWLNDPAMERHLNPKTLFRNNLERYMEAMDFYEDDKLNDKEKRYKAHLKSPEWQKKREMIITRARLCCEGCGVYLGEKGHVHHTTYKHFGNEFLFELLYLCQDCHERIHEEKRK